MNNKNGDVNISKINQGINRIEITFRFKPALKEGKGSSRNTCRGKMLCTKCFRIMLEMPVLNTTAAHKGTAVCKRALEVRQRLHNFLLCSVWILSSSLPTHNMH